MCEYCKDYYIMAVSKTTLFDFEGLVQQKKALDKMLFTDKDMARKVHNVIRESIRFARDLMVKYADKALPNDPRQAYRAVRSTVYRQILGGNINIFNSRKAGTRVEPSGNHRTRSQRTIDLQSYWGKDRGFILRFMNDGVRNRVAKNMNAHPIRRTMGDRNRKGLQKNRRYVAQRTYKGDIGYRGDVAGKHWFSGASQSVMERAAQELSDKIDALIEQQFKS